MNADLRAQFPILHQEINGRPLVYLDNAATVQKPQAVLDVSRAYYSELNANIHRGVHYLSRKATDAHEKARTSIAKHLNAPHEHEVIFTSGTTDGINLVADTLSLSGKITTGDRILISGLEHHSNIVPWQMLCQRTGATLDVIPVTDSGECDLSDIDSLLTEKTKLVAVSQVSNALGTINPIDILIAKAKKVGAWTLIDGAQSAPHMAIDVQAIGCDFFVFSGHKTYAPTGIGILWGRTELLEMLPPWRGGGEMIKQVTFEKTTYNELPFKYEAGTPNIEGGIALAAALEWMQDIGLDTITAHEDKLLMLATEAISEIDGIKIYGTAPNKASVLSFGIEGIHHFDLGTLMDQMGVGVRTGHHCCQPLMQRFGITGTTRASFAIYNTEQEVETLINAVRKAATMLR
ncbi:aminotransferase class V-fold PLP-dependent enzyme [Rubritalea profundi]|uniref:Cysteine desulfurase n=1 Tax=Rubritalea profundi TaxID=1658618 RepID=A0A2S7U2F4_9BACT|nr:cysteine desulfurase [Rubritalea profundi]PQJ29168.1 cysteine sulfinate desulfinase [Rubritalea profundi]